ncbi:hypothetical protein PPYR_11838 [Photinus pyralis]|uniref:Wolframin n=2 Tax=Photinus pyralis TaxID=7054 RepID=A0A5N4ACI4_PHOPY|nr:wolframin-like isoform X2 [Photinus pyralis]KAB0794999.1 hypothetical protein PPYR_11838 [Photinus pyralis]
MAGVVPSKKSTSARKQWAIHDGPYGSLKRLRNQLANDGCAESQMVLAKQLLQEECELETEKRENCRLGVYWLMKSSEQGNSEATELLRSCFLSGKGITEHNYMDVKLCINMTQDEKLARKAARDLFSSLSNGEDYITSQQLQRRILEIDKQQSTSNAIQKNRSYNCNGSGEPSNGELVDNYDEQGSDSDQDVDWTGRSVDGNQKLTEENLVSAAVDYSHGHLPLVNRGVTFSDLNLCALDEIPVVHRSILHPFLTCKILYFKLIRALGCSPIGSYIPSIQSDIQLVLMMCLYSFVSCNSVLHFVPMATYYITFVTMVISTFQMLQMGNHYHDFQVWSNLFITYSGGSLNAAEAEYQFIRNNLKPFAHFFLALLINLLVYPIISDQWIPQSELTILAFCLTFITLHSFTHRERGESATALLTLLSFATNVLAKYPYETDAVVTQGWRFLDLKIPTFASYIIGNGIEFCINFRILFYILIPFLLVCIASRRNWSGTYKCLIPHCVTLSWLQIAIINSQGATTFGLMRGTLALVGIVMFLPLVGLTTIILPSIALTKWVVTSVSLYSILLFLLFASSGLGISWLLARTRFRQQIAYLQVITAIVTFFILINSFSANNSSLNVHTHSSTANGITWDQYEEFCDQPNWETSTAAANQIRCAKLADVPVEWEGWVHEIKVRSITNVWRKIFGYIPKSLSQYLYCIFGESVEHDCKNLPEDVTEECLMFYDAIRTTRKCSLDNLNVYEFHIVLRRNMVLWTKTAEVVLEVGHHFSNFTLQLKPDDRIKFTGFLTNDGIIGGSKPHVLVESMRCIHCHKTELTNTEIRSVNLLTLESVLSNFNLGLKFIINFLFMPINLFE